MATAVEMPKLGNTVEDCLLGLWRKHKGDTVAAGDVIAEIETDKTTFDLTSPVDGVVLETFFEAGALVPVYTVICAIGSQGESVDTLRPHGRSLSAAASNPQDVIPVQAVKPLAESSGVHNGPMDHGGVGLAEEAHFSPRARRFAREHDFHPRAVQGSGPRGRALEDDLRRLLHASPRLSAAAPEDRSARVAPTGAEEADEKNLLHSAETNVPAQRMSSMRQKIAQRVLGSLSSTAQYTLHSSANAGGLLTVRRRTKGTATTANITINDLVMFCTVQALLEVPDLNSTLVDGIVHRHADVHLGFACDTTRGLVVPVVRNSQELSVVALSRRIKELTDQVQQGSIAVDDLNGGTFTVSNLGSFGVESFTPVLNPPQVAILGVGSVGVKAVRKPDGNIEFIDSIGLSLTLDHQVVDGAPGARFLKVLRDTIESVEPLCTI